MSSPRSRLRRSLQAQTSADLEPVSQVLTPTLAEIGFPIGLPLECVTYRLRTMAKVARRFLIRGDVQGVGYRFFAQRAAAKHQVVGYVRNEPDGSVEVLAEGPAANMESFKHDLVAGPQWATVAQVEEINVDPIGTYTSFRVER